jgi:hypothetical protein
MYSETEFTVFVLKHMNKVSLRKGSISDVDAVASVIQLVESPSSYLSVKYPNKTRSDISKHLNNRFKDSNILIDKPRNVSINTWLLHKFGYKKCSITGKIVYLDYFYRNSNSWDNLSTVSKEGEDTYRKENLAKKRARDAIRYCTKLNATPRWLNEKQLSDIQNIYKEASIKTAQTNIKHEVDHIVPLQGKNVCGLHVPWNLQILTKSENCSKSNKLLDI